MDLRELEQWWSPDYVAALQYIMTHWQDSWPLDRLCAGPLAFLAVSKPDGWVMKRGQLVPPYWALARLFVFHAGADVLTLACEIVGVTSALLLKGHPVRIRAYLPNRKQDSFGQPIALLMPSDLDREGWTDTVDMAVGMLWQEV